MRPIHLLILTGLLTLACAGPVSDSGAAPTADLSAARALFERNLEAIQQRDRQAYLDCYLAGEGLVRSGPAGLELGFDGLAAGTPADGSDDWPDELVARDLQLAWLGDGLVAGSYHYQARFGGTIRQGRSERLFRRTADGWRILVTSAFDHPAGQPGPPLALVGATLHDGRGGAPLEDAVVLTRDGRIEAVGTVGSLALPADAERVDLSGTHLVPGLVDTHVHYGQTGWADGRPDARDLRDSDPYEQVADALERHPERFHRAFLASGVTAVFDVGGFHWSRRLGPASEDDALAPHVAAAGPLLATWVPEILSLPDRSQFVHIRSEDDVRRAVTAHAAAGSDAIKVWFIARSAEDVTAGEPLLHAAGAAAREAGLPLVVHATELETARIAVQAGASLLVHSVWDQPVDQAFVDLLLERGTAYCPTLTVRRGYDQLAAGEVTDELAWQLERVSGWVAERVRRTPAEGPPPGLSAELLAARRAATARAWELGLANLATLHRAGVTVVMGTDAGNPLTLHGPSVFAEMEAMQAAGLEPAAVLRAATADAAAAMGRGHDLGVIAPGRIADLVVLPEDPAADIAHLRGLTHVVRAGVLHDAEGLRPD